MKIHGVVLTGIKEGWCFTDSALQGALIFFVTILDQGVLWVFFIRNLLSKSVQWALWLSLSFLSSWMLAQLCQSKSFKFSFGCIFYSFWQTERSLLLIWNTAKATKTISATKKPSWIPSCERVLAWFLLFVLCFVYFIFLRRTYMY